ncbi:hypothetical protein C8D92_10819 [Tamilnaduibacter salinus]|uniref:Spermidine synthase n=1 Tax=Tamilnaduibacter salinus TaxID=1484056 RepID=A0A2U1CUE5_9GAMM|nr:spermidine synthase [Tamilnaduibacter salinus]PVY70663.1 hypothetical protein C8D92_10819 [Tamilnaduibacter salinus]
MKFRLNGHVVHQVEDALGKIQVLDYRKHRVLWFDSVFEQSKIARRRPHLPVHEYNRAMLLPVIDREPAHATVLGVGGGVMVSALHHLVPACVIHGVELREAVVTIARDWFSMPDDDRVRISVSDARPALHAMPADGTDLILADLYTATRMSTAQGERRFIDRCHRALGPCGWLVLNFHRAPDLDGALLRQLRRLFADVLLYRTKTNNFVIYASRRPVAIPRPDSEQLDRLEARLPIGWARLVQRLVSSGRIDQPLGGTS